MSSIGAALGAAFVSTARAEASRINGAKSRGAKTPEGKARSAQNALKHGLRAERFTVVGDEDEDVYDAHEQALLAELAPAGALQTLLAERIARAAWRLARADRIEAQLFDRHADDTTDLGLAVIRDGNGTRAFETVLRYRRAAEGELLRALRTLKALQAEAAQAAAAAAKATALMPKEPKARANPGETVPLALAAPAPAVEEPVRPPAPRVGPNQPAPAPTGRLGPNEPGCRREPGTCAAEAGRSAHGSRAEMPAREA